MTNPILRFAIRSPATRAVNLESKPGFDADLEPNLYLQSFSRILNRESCPQLNPKAPIDWMELDRLAGIRRNELSPVC